MCFAHYRCWRMTHQSSYSDKHHTDLEWGGGLWVKHALKGKNSKHHGKFEYISFSNLVMQTITKQKKIPYLKDHIPYTIFICYSCYHSEVRGINKNKIPFLNYGFSQIRKRTSDCGALKDAALYRKQSLPRQQIFRALKHRMLIDMIKSIQVKYLDLVLPS